MKLFVSWYPGDACFWKHFMIDGLLISPTSVSRNFIIDSLNFSGEIMIDSGGYHYAKIQGRLPFAQKEVFEQQLRLLNGKQAFVLQLDFPLLPSLSAKERDKRIRISLRNAEEFIALCDGARKIIPVGVVQGYNEETIRSSIHSLKNFGYNYLAIGGLSKFAMGVYVPSWKKRKEMITKVVEMLSREVSRLHVCGVSTPKLAKGFVKNNVYSIDSAAFTKAGIFMGIYYSNPYRRYRAITARRVKEGRVGFDRVLSEPFPCECPVCQKNGPNVLLKTGKKVWNNFRAIHNLWHYLKEINGKVDPPRRENYN